MGHALKEIREKNYYEVLEVDKNASSNEINQAYLKSKNAYTTDSVALYSLLTTDECEQMLNQIEEAYTVLCDPEKRHLYDQAHGLDSKWIHTDPEFKEKKNFTSKVAPLHDASQLKQNDSDNNKISLIVAAQKFSLNFDKNQQFEQEIENCQEFSGEFLKQIREYKNVDIPRMSKMTKVSKTYINAIEEENLEVLPALAYVRGFVYQYAKCLKLNPDLVATSYLYRLKKLEEQ